MHTYIDDYKHPELSTTYFCEWFFEKYIFLKSEKLAQLFYTDLSLGYI